MPIKITDLIDEIDVMIHEACDAEGADYNEFMVALANAYGVE